MIDLLELAFACFRDSDELHCLFCSGFYLRCAGYGHSHMIIDCYVLSCGQFFTYEQFAATNDTLVQLIGFALLKHTSYRDSDIAIKDTYRYTHVY